MSGVDQVDRAVYQSPENGIAEAVCYPKSGETVTLRGGLRRGYCRPRRPPPALPSHTRRRPFPAVPKRTIVEYSQRVENAE